MANAVLAPQVTQATKANLYLKCAHLPDMDITSKTDAQITVWLNDIRGKKLLGKTEIIQDNLNPVFATHIQVCSFFMFVLLSIAFLPFSLHYLFLVRLLF
jgi:hypothetical protein